MTDIIELPLNQIALDHKIQLKARSIDNGTVAAYAEALDNGAELGPVVAFYDGQTYWIADGFHRTSAHRFLGLLTIKTDVRRGTYNDALIYAATANVAHGKPMGQTEKKEAGERLIKLTDWSDREIERQLSLGRGTVTKWRQSLSGEISPDKPRTVNRNGSTYTMDTSGIGKKAEPPIADTRSMFADDPDLNEALEDESKPVCQECGQVYDGPSCPDCRIAETIRPYYQNGNVTVYNYDFRKVLPSLDDGFVIFDPPYNIGFKYDLYEDNLPDEDYIEMLAEFQRFSKVVVIQYPEEMQRLVVPALGPPDHCSVWCYNSNTSRRFRLINWYGLTPDYSRIKQPYKNPKDRRVAELIANGNGGSDLYEWWDDIQIVKNVSEEKTSHPCPVPEALIKRIICLGADPGDVIIDPFAGGLTTLKAAKDLGYQSIGMELSVDYIEGGIKRLWQPEIFGSPII